jgi:hypothetical protein
MMMFAKFSWTKIFTKNLRPFPYLQIFIIKQTTIMEIQENKSNNLIIIIPLIDTCGDSIESAIQINCMHINYVIPIQNKIIDYLMDDMPWTKTEQSLIFAENDKRYDKIGVVGLSHDGSTQKHEFWFDITECFES